MELNWLPDHEAVEQIVGTIGPLLADEKAGSVLSMRNGAIPAAIDPRRSHVIWADVGDRPLQEWQFLFSLKAIMDADAELPTFRTHLAELGRARASAGDFVAPAGFIFHMSRCGSTLLGNVLSGSPRHLVINQPGPLQDGFWTYLTKDWTVTRERGEGDHAIEPAQLFRDLISLILRRRSLAPAHGFIKFRSWAVLFLPFIQRAFPSVPCLFLYRDPNEVLASVLQKKNVAAFATRAQRAFLAGCSESELDGIDEVEFMLRCYDSYFKCVLDADHTNLAVMNYRCLAPSSLPLLLERAFSLEANDAEMASMTDRFQFYSKDSATTPTRFDGSRDLAAKRAILIGQDVSTLRPSLMERYAQLDSSPMNVSSFAPLGH